MLIKRIALLMMVFTLSLSAPVLAAESGTGVIEGQLVNETNGGSSVANQDITLKTYLNDAEVDAITTKTDNEGHFVFDGLSTESGYSYEVMLVFQQAEYYSEWLSLDEGETTKSVEVTVYDSTTSDEAIKVEMTHTIIYVGQDSLKVIEYFLFVNEADRTYIGSKEIAEDGTRETLKFSLPKEATESQLTLGLMECCIRGSEEGFIDTMPVLPGSKEVAYSYKVNYNSSRYTFALKVDYPTSRYDLLFQGESIEVTGNQLAEEEPMDIEGTWFKHFAGSDFTRGDVLEIQLSGLPQTSNQGAILWVVLTLVVLGTGFSFVYLIRRRRLQPVSSEDGLEQQRQRLLVELAHLDDDFEAGKIPEKSYRRLRSARKTQLVELMQRAKEESDRR